MLNYMCQVGVQHSHITTMKGAVIRRGLHKQTNKTVKHKSLEQTWYMSH